MEKKDLDALRDKILAGVQFLPAACNGNRGYYQINDHQVFAPSPPRIVPVTPGVDNVELCLSLTTVQDFEQYMLLVFDRCTDRINEFDMTDIGKMRPYFGEFANDAATWAEGAISRIKSIAIADSIMNEIKPSAPSSPWVGYADTDPLAAAKAEVEIQKAKISAPPIKVVLPEGMSLEEELAKANIILGNGIVYNGDSGPSYIKENPFI